MPKLVGSLPNEVKDDKIQFIIKHLYIFLVIKTRVQNFFKK